jgi:hypothetical protein
MFPFTAITALLTEQISDKETIYQMTNTDTALHEFIQAQVWQGVSLTILIAVMLWAIFSKTEY